MCAVGMSLLFLLLLQQHCQVNGMVSQFNKDEEDVVGLSPQEWEYKATRYSDTDLDQRLRARQRQTEVVESYGIFIYMDMNVGMDKRGNG